jgi:anthranilate phosphoribosyltransferase
MRRHAVFVDPAACRWWTPAARAATACGTFNISTTRRFVVAGAGVPVAKHGNRAITSQLRLGRRAGGAGREPRRAAGDVEETASARPASGSCSRRLHPAMKHAMGPRRELGVRTIFNMLGPLTNPAGAKGQMLGVFAPS